MSASDHLGKIQFGKWHGKAFRVVKTPSGRATDVKTGAVLPDDPRRVSIVTPENADAWNWPKADKKQIKSVRKNFDRIQRDPRSQYKMEQIRRSMG